MTWLNRLPLRVRLVAGFALAMAIVLTGAGAFVAWRVEVALDARAKAEVAAAYTAALAADAMKVTAQDLLRLGVIDRIVAEPVGGAHRAPQAAAATLKAALGEELATLSKETPAALQAARRRKFLSMGAL